MVKTPEIQFRTMQPEDLEPCVDLYRSIYRERPWGENWKHSEAKHRLDEVFGNPNRFCFGGWDKDDLIAFCLGTLITRMDRQSAQICEFGVDPDLEHSERIGTALLDFTVNTLEGRGVVSIYTMIRLENPAFEMFQKTGFHISRHYHVLVHRVEEK